MKLYTHTFKGTVYDDKVKKSVKLVSFNTGIQISYLAASPREDNKQQSREQQTATRRGKSWQRTATLYTASQNLKNSKFKMLKGEET